MQLTELLNIVGDEKKKGLINIDDWKFNDASHLKDMKFEFDGDYVMSLEKPAIKIYKKKTPKGECFFLEDKNGIQIFQEFEKIIEYFNKYSQPEIDKERG
jgi:hypothetical protein